MVRVNPNHAYNYDYTALWAHYNAVGVRSLCIIDGCFKQSVNYIQFFFFIKTNFIPEKVTQQLDCLMETVMSLMRKPRQIKQWCSGPQGSNCGKTTKTLLLEHEGPASNKGP